MPEIYDSAQYREHLNDGGSRLPRYFVYLERRAADGDRDMVMYWADGRNRHDDVAARANNDHPDTSVFSVQFDRTVLI